LVKMPMDSVTEENVARLLNTKGDKESELEKIKSTLIQQMWLGELDLLKEQYLEYKEDRTRLMSCEEKKKKLVVKKTGVIKKKIIISDE
jgi:hypothetical protein